jgi:hypothetical protein
VRWVAESKRPFQIVNDRGFQSLMKTGRPEYHIPSMHTVSRDVKQAFVEARKGVAKMLQVTYNKLLYKYKYTKILPNTRNTKGSSTMPQMPGLLRIIKLMSHLLSTLRMKGLRFPCFWTWLKLRRRTQGLTLPPPSPKS